MHGERAGMCPACVTDRVEAMNELTKRVITLNTDPGWRTPQPGLMEGGKRGREKWIRDCGRRRDGGWKQLIWGDRETGWDGAWWMKKERWMREKAGWSKGIWGMGHNMFSTSRWKRKEGRKDGEREGLWMLLIEWLVKGTKIEEIRWRVGGWVVSLVGKMKLWNEGLQQMTSLQRPPKSGRLERKSDVGAYAQE